MFSEQTIYKPGILSDYAYFFDLIACNEIMYFFSIHFIEKKNNAFMLYIFTNYLNALTKIIILIIL